LLPDFLPGRLLVDVSGEAVKTGVRFVSVGLAPVVQAAQLFAPFTAKTGIQHYLGLFLTALLLASIFAAGLAWRALRMAAMITASWWKVLLLWRHWTNGWVGFDAVDITLKVDRGLVLPIQAQQADVIADQIDDGHAPVP